MDELLIVDADAHVRDRDEAYRARLLEALRRRPLFPFPNWDRQCGGTLGQAVHTPEEHVRDMAVEGIDFQVLFPTFGLHLMRVREVELAVALCRAYNDFVAEFCQGAPERLAAVAMIPMQDPVEAPRELHRAVTELGSIGAMVPAYLPHRNLADRTYDDFYAEAQRLDVPVAVHALGDDTEIQRFDNFLSVHTVGHPVDIMCAVVTYFVAGFPERFPDLRLGFLEAGVGWVPWWLDRLDEEWEFRPHEAPLLKAKPSEYLKTGRYFFSCEPEERMLGRVVEEMGADQIMFASDYPHWDSGFPHTTRHVRERTDLSEVSKRKILGENALRFFPALVARLAIGSS
jgi:uncharacterized protein